MNKALIHEMQEAYRSHKLRPIPGTFLLDDFACPLTALAISRGVVDKNDPDLGLDQEKNPVFAWASDEFGAAWVHGFVNAFDDEDKTSDDPEYVAGYTLGELARGQAFRRHP
jgi:hypothetical protein